MGIIRNDELDSSGIKAIVEGLMWEYIPKEYKENLILAIKNGIIGTLDN